MKEINLENMDSELLMELLGTLEGLSDSVDEIEGGLKNEKSHD